MIRAADRPPRQWKLSPRDASSPFSLCSARSDLNSRGDAAVTPALSQSISVFVPPARFPDVKLLIKLRPIPLERSQLPATFLISLFSLPCDSWIKLASSSARLFVLWQDSNIGCIDKGGSGVQACCSGERTVGERSRRDGIKCAPCNKTKVNG